MILLSVAYVLSRLATQAGPDAIGTALNNLAGSVQQDATLVGATVFLVSVIIAGVMRMVAFGSERRVAISNMALTSAVVGLVIMLLATVLLNALKQILG